MNMLLGKQRFVRYNAAYLVLSFISWKSGRGQPRAPLRNADVQRRINPCATVTIHCPEQGALYQWDIIQEMTSPLVCPAESMFLYFPPIAPLQTGSEKLSKNGLDQLPHTVAYTPQSPAHR